MSNTKLFLGKKRGYCVPVWFIPKIVQWITGRIEPGDFLYAVLYNDLVAAVGSADDVSLECLSGIIKFLYNETPCECWGSPEKVEAWLELSDGGHDLIARAWAEENPDFVGPQPAEFVEVQTGAPDIIDHVRSLKKRHELMTETFRAMYEVIEEGLPSDALERIKTKYGIASDVPLIDEIIERITNATP